MQITVEPMKDQQARDYAQQMATVLEVAPRQQWIPSAADRLRLTEADYLARAAAGLAAFDEAVSNAALNYAYQLLDAAMRGEANPSEAKAEAAQALAFTRWAEERQKQAT